MVPRWISNKAANATASELVETLVALAQLRYRNPWLMGRLAELLAKRRKGGVQALTGADLVATAAALAKLRSPCDKLLDALCDEAASRLEQHDARNGSSSGRSSSSSDDGSISSSSGGGGKPQGDMPESHATAADMGAGSQPMQSSQPLWGSGITAAQRATVRQLAPSHVATLLSSMATLRHKHVRLLQAACRSGMQQSTVAASVGPWSPCDVAAVAWAAANWGAAPVPLLRHAEVITATALAAKGGAAAPDWAALRSALCSAWALLAAGTCSTVGDSSGAGSVSVVGSDGGSGPSVETLEVLQAALTHAAAATSDPVEQLTALGPELVQVAEHARRHHGMQLLPSDSVEAAYRAAARDHARHSLRGAALRDVASEVAFHIDSSSNSGSSGSSGGGSASSPGTVELTQWVPGTYLLVDVASYPPTDCTAASTDDRPPVAFLYADSTSRDNTGTMLGYARVHSHQLGQAGWQVVWVDAAAWGAARERAAKRRLLDRVRSASTAPSTPV